LLKPVEELTWKTQEALLKYGEFGTESNPDPISLSDSKSESGSPMEEVRKPGNKVKRKNTSTPQDRDRGEPGPSSRIPEEDPFRILL
jgi:hypothetical protein